MSGLTQKIKSTPWRIILGVLSIIPIVIIASIMGLQQTPQNLGLGWIVLVAIIQALLDPQGTVAFARGIGTVVEVGTIEAAL